STFVPILVNDVSHPCAVAPEPPRHRLRVPVRGCVDPNFVLGSEFGQKIGRAEPERFVHPRPQPPPNATRFVLRAGLVAAERVVEVEGDSHIRDTRPGRVRFAHALPSTRSITQQPRTCVRDASRQWESMSALSQPASWSASARIGIAPKSRDSYIWRARVTA